MAFSMLDDLEYDLMSACLKFEGKWWANHWFQNKEVKELYAEVRKLDAGSAICVVTQANKGVHPLDTAVKQKQILKAVNTINNPNIGG